MLIDRDYEPIEVLDFGVARLIIHQAVDLGAQLTSSFSYLGTPQYAEPEYFDGRIDRRSDIDSIGMMLYVAVTGRLPFNGKTATQTILMVLRDPGPVIDPAIATA